MGGQLTYILQHERSRPFGVDDLSYVENEVAAVIVKAAHIPDDAERLAGKTRQQNVVVRNRVGRDLGDVSSRLYAEVALISPPSLGVNITSESAPHAQPGSGYMKAADATEQIRER